MRKYNPIDFKWRHYEGEIILLCVRWYLRYRLSYRNLSEMMEERGLEISPSTIYRWVQRYAPGIQKRVSYFYAYPLLKHLLFLNGLLLFLLKCRKG